MDDRYLYVLVSKTALAIGDIGRSYGRRRKAQLRSLAAARMITLSLYPGISRVWHYIAVNRGNALDGAAEGYELLFGIKLNGAYDIVTLGRLFK